MTKLVRCQLLAVSAQSTLLSVIFPVPHYFSFLHHCCKTTLLGVTSSPFSPVTFQGAFHVFPCLCLGCSFSPYSSSALVHQFSTLRSFHSPEIRNLHCFLLSTPSPITSLPYVHRCKACTCCTTCFYAHK
ncbi:hypothetical protein HJG60_010666 [Phyllostomus discolor]|uniref:Uncharacterized protein n=1 Tax=Phyllostomus discolor TaxID=89673 RepID=A0A834AHV4_9CHIR|nr:hypothetical protein HJG60_010666 [Phyllostomus discolor]